MLKALQTETLEAAPIDQGMSDVIEQYCGISDLGGFLQAGEGPSNARLGGQVGTEEDYGESIIGSLEFNSEDDKLSDDEEVLEEVSQ